jgi:type I restriction enzyme R subunit
MATPEDRAREQIDQALEQAGWKVQDYKSANLQAGRGVVLRSFPLASGHGFADYLLHIDGKAAGVIEAKKEGFPLAGVEAQAVKYSAGLPRTLPIYLTRADRLRQAILHSAFSGRFAEPPQNGHG